MPAMKTSSPQTLEQTLRSFLATSAMALGLTAGASIPAVALGASPIIPEPQYWSSHTGKFMGMSGQLLISSITVRAKYRHGDSAPSKNIK